MESSAKLLGHPIHQMLIVFPLGLLATSAAFDIAALITNTGTFAVDRLGVGIDDGASLNAPNSFLHP